MEDVSQAFCCFGELSSPSKVSGSSYQALTKREVEVAAKAEEADAS